MLSPRQESVAAQLRDLIGEGPAVLFSDACVVLSQEPRLASASHVVAHLLREVESAVRAVLQPPLDPQAVKGGDKHKASIRAVLGELGVSADEPVAEFWLGLTGEGNPSGLAMKAHRSALNAPRPADEAFVEFVNSVEELFDLLLKQFKNRYISTIARLDELLTETPSADGVKRLRNNFSQNFATLSYFFRNAQAGWLAPLAEGRYFTAPPMLILHPEDGTAEMPMWPESNFLVRIAPVAPTVAVDVALAIPATDNMRVNSDIVEIALLVPPDESARLVPRIIELIASPFGVLVPTRIGTLCRHLADGGHPDEAVQAAEPLLAKVPSPVSSRGGDTWSYAEILRNDIPALTSAVGLPVLILLAGPLEQAVAAQATGHLKERHQDLSFSWRPGIDEQPPGLDSDPLNALVSAVRDTSARLIDEGLASISEIVAALESHDWPVFRRLALFLLDFRNDGADDLIEARLTDQHAIRDSNLTREFLTLASRHCASISPKGQTTLLALIDQGPEMNEWARQYEEGTGQPPTPAITQVRIDRWQRDRLAAVEAILTAEWQDRYHAMIAEYGDAPDPIASFFPAVRQISFDSPVPAAQLASMPIADVVEFLLTWEPPTSFLGQSRFSLASALGDAVQQDAARWSAEADAFIGLPPVYVSAFISSLWRAIRSGAVLAWDPVFRLGAWADAQAVAALTSTDDLGSAEWRDTRLNMLRLLDAGFREGATQAPATSKDTAWAIIENAAADSDPSIGAEESAYEGEGRRSPGELALNHVRPQAVTTAIAFAQWARRQAPDADLTQFHSLLDRHLDPQHEPSECVRWTYGESFAQLAHLDREWAAEHASAIFPEAPAESHLWAAAWDAYTNGPVLLDVFTILADQYQMATVLLKPDDAGRRPEAHAFSLGRHLITLYWHGELALDDQLLERYYQNGPASVRIHLIRFLGQGISAAAIDGTLGERLRRFWESRIQAVRDGADASELTAFSEWFGVGKLGDSWELQQLNDVLPLAGRVESEHQVLPRLASLAPAHTVMCLTVLERWLRTSLASWTLQRHETDIRTILKAGTDSGTPQSAEAVTAVVSLCFNAGIDLRDALPPNSPPAA